MSPVAVMRGVLRLGAAVFLASAVLLLALPGWFTEQLGMPASDATSWTMRMLAAALIALAGQMAIVSRGPYARAGARVMLVGGGILTLLTLVVPGPWTWLRVAYVAFGSGFWLAYAALLIADRRAPATPRL